MLVGTQQFGIENVKYQVIASVFLIVGGSTAAQEISCPAKFELSDSNSFVVQADGWEVRRFPVKQLLDGFEVNFGDPRQSNGAIYDEVRTTRVGANGEEKVYIWNLKNVNDPYVTCSYTFTSFGLVKKADGLTRCELRTQKKHPDVNERIVSARCF